MIGPGAGVRGRAHLVPLYPETYAMTSPRGGIVHLRSLALVPLYPETYAMTSPRGGIVRLRARAFTPFISLVRVCEEGVNPFKPEAKCDSAKGGINSLCKSPC